MSNILKELKAEISRLAKKEAKQVVSPVKKASSTYRALIAGLRKQVAGLQKELASLKRAMPKADKVLEGKTEPEGRFWITAKGVKALRKRLGLTQAVFGKLVDVSMPTVVNWEKAEGKIDIRKKATMARLQDIKGKGKREVAEMLPKEARAPKAKAKTTRKLKRFDLLKGLIEPVAGKVEPTVKTKAQKS